MNIKVLFIFLFFKMSDSYKHTNINKKRLMKPFINRQRNYRVHSENYILWEDGEIEWDQGELTFTEKEFKKKINTTNTLSNNNIKFDCSKNCNNCKKN